MSSWVRYCVAVYVGLLISGALARPPWTYPSPAEPAPRPAHLDRNPLVPQAPKSEDPLEQKDSQSTAQRFTSDTLTG